ncbi:MAG: MBL fold metallo-hydrolase [Phycisphaerales bacterium]|nr:MAG: MBL fold metallo-hydrolase [Phycisphaerales bacterium]
MFMRLVYDEKLAQAAYLIGCQKTGEAIVIDPERDVDRYIELAREHGLRVTAVAETHIHADFVSGAREMGERTGATVYVSGEGGDEWSSQWLDQKLGGGSYAHRVLRDGDTFRVGNIELRAVHTPGHTPEHLSYLVTDLGAGASEPIGMATGDFVFVGDLGRPDLLESAAGQSGAMEPSARRLFATVRKLESVPDFVQVWPGHGAGSACGKALGGVPTSTMGYERRFNPAIRAAGDERGFVAFILSGQPEPPLYFATMKRVNKEGPRVLGGLPDTRELTSAELGALDTGSVALLDTREWASFRDGHVPGALSMPLSRSFNTDAGSLVRADEAIVLVVEASRLEEAVRDLVRIGLDRIEGWCPPEAVAGYAEAGGRLAQIEEVGVETAAGMVEGGVRVLDVRRKTEHDASRIAGSTNIAHTRLADRMDEVPLGDGVLLVHCQGGVRSARASAYLQRMGRRVVNLQGGFGAWAKSQPVER